jgi:glycosyltransferase involved in cell wall biosynthesis
MKIAVFIEKITRSNGGASSAIDFVIEANSLGHDITIFTLFSGDVELEMSLKARSIQLRKFLLADAEARFRSRFNQLKSRLNFKKAFRVTVNPFELYFDVSALNSDAKLLIKSAWPEAHIMKNHAGDVDSFMRDHMGGKSSAVYIEKFENCDSILFQSSRQLVESENKFKNIEIQRILLEPTCEELNIRNEQGLLEKDFFNLVVVGSIQPRKNQLDALRVCKQLNNLGHKVKMTFVGGVSDNVYMEHLVRYINEWDLKNSVKFVGFTKDYLKYLICADLLLQTSTHEGVSRILREAMYYKIPVAAFKLPGTVDLLNDQGLLVNGPEELEELVKLISKAYQNHSLSDLASNMHMRYLHRNSRRVYNKNLSQILKNI